MVGPKWDNSAHTEKITLSYLCVIWSSDACCITKANLIHVSLCRFLSV